MRHRPHNPAASSSGTPSRRCQTGWRSVLVNHRCGLPQDDEDTMRGRDIMTDNRATKQQGRLATKNYRGKSLGRLLAAAVALAALLLSAAPSSAEQEESVIKVSGVNTEFSYGRYVISGYVANIGSVTVDDISLKAVVMDESREEIGLQRHQLQYPVRQGEKTPFRVSIPVDKKPAGFGIVVVCSADRVILELK